MKDSYQRHKDYYRRHPELYESDFESRVDTRVNNLTWRIGNVIGFGAYALAAIEYFVAVQYGDTPMQDAMTAFISPPGMILCAGLGVIGGTTIGNISRPLIQRRVRAEMQRMQTDSDLENK